MKRNLYRLRFPFYKSLIVTVLFVTLQKTYLL